MVSSASDACHGIPAFLRLEEPCDRKSHDGRYPKLVVLKALLRIKTTPETAIRKSKLALFRYLLTKFNHDSHDDVPSHPA